MAEAKFRIVRERAIGPLPPKKREQWAKLMARRDRLAAEEAKFEEAVNKFTAKLQSSVYVPGKIKHAPFHRGYKLNETGTVYQVVCDCLVCQAQVHGLSVSQTAEMMIKENLIKPDMIHKFRQEAEIIEQMPTKKCTHRVLMN